MTPITAPDCPSVAFPVRPLALGWDDVLPHRGYLVRFARRRLHDPALAEDLVHDVFEAVASGRAVFGGRSALRSWLTGILKHKIVDLVRQRSSLNSLDDDLDSAACQALECALPQPDELAQQRQTLRLVLRGIDALPQCLREVMQLRVLQDQSSREVCRALGITENNLFQRLFRARQSLASNRLMALH